MKDACSFDGCDRSVKCIKLCASHHSQYLRGKPLSVLGSGSKYWADLDSEAPSGHKVCRSCLEIKGTEEFASTQPTRSKDGRYAYCLECSRFKEKLWKYGLSKEEYILLHESQSGCCAICKIEIPVLTRDVHLDHCHETKKVRGILCRHCNLGLGHFDDDPNKLEEAAKYLRREGV